VIEGGGNLQHTPQMLLGFIMTVAAKRYNKSSVNVQIGGSLTRSSEVIS
jgi:hypothetical protein